MQLISLCKGGKTKQTLYKDKEPPLRASQFVWEKLTKKIGFRAKAGEAATSLPVEPARSSGGGGAARQVSGRQHDRPSPGAKRWPEPLTLPLQALILPPFPPPQPPSCISSHDPVKNLNRNVKKRKKEKRKVSCNSSLCTRPAWHGKKKLPHASQV